MRLVVIKPKEDLHYFLLVSGLIMIEASNISDVLDTKDLGSMVKFLFLFAYEPLRCFQEKFQHLFPYKQAFLDMFYHCFYIVQVFIACSNHLPSFFSNHTLVLTCFGLRFNKFIFKTNLERIGGTLQVPFVNWTFQKNKVVNAEEGLKTSEDLLAKLSNRF